MDKQPEDRQIVYMAPYPGMCDGTTHGDEIDLFELWSIIWRAKFFIVGFTLAATLAAAWVALYVLPISYQSKAVLVPNGSAGGVSGMAALASSLPVSFGLPGGDKVNTLEAFLQSRNLQQKLIEKYDLLPRYYKDKWDATKKVWLVSDPKDAPTVVGALQSNLLAGAYHESQDKKTQLISISWEDEDPAFAAEMLKRVISEVEYYLANDYVSDAKRERQFIETQLASATRELEHWEQQVPSDTLTLAKIQRELLATTTVYTELRKQVELAKISEAKELVNFKVLDPPFVPERKFKPKRALICVMTLVSAGMLSIIMVFVWHALVVHSQKKKQ